MAAPTWPRVLVAAVAAGLLVGVAAASPGDELVQAAPAEPAAGADAEPPPPPVTRAPADLPPISVSGALPAGPQGVQTTTGVEGRTVALTFDDGPHPQVTPTLLNLLRDLEVTATFCVLGRQVSEHPDITRRIVAEGHTLCNHSRTHDVHLPTRPSGRIHDEVVGTLETIQEVVPGAPVPFWRPPGGRFHPAVDEVVHSAGMVPLGWSVDPRDWDGPGPDAVVDRVLTEVRPGAVVLLHDGGDDGVEMMAALTLIVEALRAAGYTFVVPAA